ncbi:MAG: PD-(D/E)XK nuclease family transposase [Butyrivibrio sp.]|nr:PD-(D/E)XK nuclease family transposase [Butyrivibrio sp.]
MFLYIYSEAFKLLIVVVELPKLPSLNDGTSLYDWVKFIKAETREEFEMLAKQSKYLEAAYETLDQISADEEKRHQYLRREVALYDQNTLMEENYERGKMAGKAIMLKALYKDGVTVEQLAEKYNLPVSEVVFLLQMETD